MWLYDHWQSYLRICHVETLSGEKPHDRVCSPLKRSWPEQSRWGLLEPLRTYCWIWGWRYVSSKVENSANLVHDLSTTCWISYNLEIWTRKTTNLMRIECRPHKSRSRYNASSKGLQFPQQASQVVWWISDSVLVVDPADRCIPKLGRMRFCSLQRSADLTALYFTRQTAVPEDEGARWMVCLLWILQGALFEMDFCSDQLISCENNRGLYLDGRRKSRFLPFYNHD